MASNKSILTSFGRELYSLISEHVGETSTFCIDYGIAETTLYRWCHGQAELNLRKVGYLAEYFSSKSGSPPMFFVIRLVSKHDTIRAVQAIYDKKTNKDRLEKLEKRWPKNI